MSVQQPEIGEVTEAVARPNPTGATGSLASLMQDLHVNLRLSVVIFSLNIAIDVLFA